MAVVAWLVLGLICGFVASLLVNRRGEGLFMDIVWGSSERWWPGSLHCLPVCAASAG